MLAGMGLLGASMLRNNAVPRWISVLTLLGMVGFFLPIPPPRGCPIHLRSAARHRRHRHRRPDDAPPRWLAALGEVHARPVTAGDALQTIPA